MADPQSDTVNTTVKGRGLVLASLSYKPSHKRDAVLRRVSAAAIDVQLTRRRRDTEKMKMEGEEAGTEETKGGDESVCRGVGGRGGGDGGDERRG